MWIHDCDGLKKYLKLRECQSSGELMTQSRNLSSTSNLPYQLHLLIAIVNNVFWFIIFNFVFLLLFHLQFFNFILTIFFIQIQWGGNFNAFPILLSRFSFDASFFFEVKAWDYVFIIIDCFFSVFFHNFFGNLNSSQTKNTTGNHKW